MKAKDQEGMDRIVQLVDKAINFQKKLTAESIKVGSVPIDTLLNRCLSYIEEVESMSVPSKYRVDKHKAKKVLYNIYNHLQNYHGLERQDYNDKRTVSIEELDHEEGDLIPEGAYMYSGGLGYRHVNWNAPYLLSTHSKGHKRYDPYWKPGPIKPCKILPSVRTDLCNYFLDDIKLCYKPKETLEEWREKMAKEKEEILNEVRSV